MHACRKDTFVAETMALKTDMIRQIRQTSTLTETAREQALAFAKDYREIPGPAQRGVAGWLFADLWARPGAYPLALRQAEAACRQAPGNGLFVRTLGAAQYRNGQYAAALKTLTESEKLNVGRDKRSHPADLAFLAMTQFQLGMKAEAAATLARLREVMKTWPFNRDAEDLFHEAERLIDPRK